MNNEEWVKMKNEPPPMFTPPVAFSSVLGTNAVPTSNLPPTFFITDAISEEDESIVAVRPAANSVEIPDVMLFTHPVS